MGGGDGEGGTRIRAQCRAAVEAEPADPEQPGTNDRQREIMRREILAAVSVPFADDAGRHQPGYSGIEMHHGAAGKIKHSCLGEKAAAPDPVRNRHIDEYQPGSGKPQESGEPHAVGDRAGNQRHGDDRKCHLVADE